MNDTETCTAIDHHGTNENLAAGIIEWRLLIATARLELDDDRSLELKQMLQQNIKWDTVLSQSVMHGTAGLLFKHLSALPSEAGVPNAVLERLREIYLRIIASGMQQLAQFQEVAHTLGETGVEIIALKGAVLAESLYGDLGLRPMSDVDLIIREYDWPKVSNVLKLFNYCSAGLKFGPLPPKLTRYDVQSHVQFVSPAETCLEFQFDLFTLGIGMRDMEGVWRRSREAEVAGARVRILGPEDQLLHMVVHANRHGCSRLKWLVDIAEILRQKEVIDWSLMEQIACREKVSAIVFLTLKHIERLLETELVPGAILERLKPRGYQRAAWNFLWPQKQLDDFRGRYEDGVCYYFYRPLSGWNLLNFVLMGRVRDKLAYQARWIVPSLGWMAQTYGQPRSLKLLKYYPLRLMSRARKRTGKR